MRRLTPPSLVTVIHTNRVSGVEGNHDSSILIDSSFDDKRSWSNTFLVLYGNDVPLSLEVVKESNVLIVGVFSYGVP